MDFDKIQRLKIGERVVINGMNFLVENLYKGIKVSIVKEFTLKADNGDIYMLQMVFNDKTMFFWKHDPRNKKPTYQNEQLIPIQTVDLIQ